MVPDSKRHVLYTAENSSTENHCGRVFCEITDINGYNRTCLSDTGLFQCMYGGGGVGGREEGAVDCDDAVGNDMVCATGAGKERGRNVESGLAMWL